MLFNGAEPISAELCETFLTTLAPFRLKRQAMFPVYGLAEATLAVTLPRPGRGPRSIRPKNGAEKGSVSSWQEGVRTHGDPVGLGRPVKDCAVRICDARDRILGEGLIGEVQIHGDNVTSGYYRNPEATQRAFTRDGWLRTGDLGFFREKSLAIIGRIKDVIFKNGQNFYLGELERIAAARCGMDPDRIMICGIEDSRASSKVIAFVQHPRDPASFPPLAVRLRKALGGELALELDAVLPIKKLPRTTSGKPRRFKLGEDYRAGRFAQIEQRVAASIQEWEQRQESADWETDLEIQLAQIWKETLGKTRIGPSESFFELGGDSLKAALLSTRIGKELQVKFSLNEVFAYPTLAEQAFHIARSRESHSPSIEPLEKRESYPLSSEQGRIFFHYQLNRESLSYNNGYLLEIKGALDERRLEGALGVLCQRHEILRTCFSARMGLPVQKVLDDLNPRIQVIDAPGDKIEEVLHSLPRPFDLSNPPLLRVFLLEEGLHQCCLFLEIHHIICDGSSLGMLVEEWFRIYAGEELDLPTLQYRDYAVWQEELLSSEAIREEQSFWRRNMGRDLPRLELAPDFARPSLPDERCGVVIFHVEAAQAKALKKLAQSNRATLGMALLGLYCLMLSRYSGQRDLVIGTVLAGRNVYGLSKLIGMFVKTIAWRLGVDTRFSFIDLIVRVKDHFLEVYQNQNYPFEKIVEMVVEDRELSRHPLFDVLFAFQNFDLPAIEVSGLQARILPYASRHSEFDLALEIMDMGDSLRCLLKYQASLFRQETVEGMSKAFLLMIEQALASPWTALRKMGLVSDSDRRKFLQELEKEDSPPGEQVSVVEVFRARAMAEPNRPGMDGEGRTMTYGEVRHAVDRFAMVLKSKGVQEETPVALLVEPSMEQVIAVLAVLRAGAAFVPLDIEHPPARKALILEDCGARVLITGKETSMEIDFSGTVIPVAVEACLRPGKTLGSRKPEKGGRLAYIIYTSGSSGKPKGVLVEHRGLLNFLRCLSNAFPARASDCWLYKTSYTFDAANHELFLWFFGRGRLWIAGSRLDRSPEELTRIMKQRAISHACFVPSTLSLWLEFLKPEDFDALYHLKYLIVGGESFPRNLANRVLETFPNLTLVNSYGPTEASVTTSFDEIRFLDEKSAPPIGRPLPNTRVYILDSYGHLAPVGMAGEICIAGMGLARGYLGNTALTACKFVPDPFFRGRRMYLSGDFGRWQADGRIDFLGRKDDQLKFRGYRVELGEVAAHLKAHPLVEDALVIGKPVDGFGHSLCAYLLLRTETKTEDIRHFLEKRLPEYMIPAYFIPLEQFPLTSSGKLNMRALPEPSHDNLTRAAYVPPQSNTEKRIAEVWQDLLKVERVGARDHFFKLGGHSLLAARTMATIHKETGVELGVRHLFETPTLSALAARVDRALARSRVSTHFEEELTQLRSRLDVELLVNLFQLGDKVIRVWFTSANPQTIQTLLRKEFHLDAWPHYVLAERRMGQRVPRARNRRVSPETLASILNLQPEPRDMTPLNERFQGAIVGFRDKLNSGLAGRTPLATYDCGYHPQWFVIRDMRSFLFAEFYGSHGLDMPAITRAIQLLIQKQPLLRSILVREENGFVFREYEDLCLDKVPYFDLSGFQQVAQFTLLDRIRELMRENLAHSSPLDHLLFNLVVVKLNFSEYKIIFVFDHIIADYDSVRVVNYHFESCERSQVLYAPPGARDDSANSDKKINRLPDYHVESYRTFSNLSAVTIHDNKILRFKKSAEYLQYRDLVIDLQKRYGTRQSIVFSEPCHLEVWIKDVQTYDLVPNYHGLGLAISVKVLSSLFGLDQVPLRVLVNRRLFSGVSFYNTIGDFHDSVPVVFETDHISPETCYQKLQSVDREFSEAGFYISALAVDSEIYRSVFRSPFNFNYVGKIPPKEETESLTNARPFPFVGYPVFAYLRGMKLGLIFFHGMDEACEAMLHESMGRIADHYQLNRLKNPN